VGHDDSRSRQRCCRFFGSGVSGGELGARFGPSLMPGRIRAPGSICRILARGRGARGSARHPVPAFSSALSCFDGYRSARLPANLIQAQRDYFGAHTYERVDAPRGKFFHLDWPDLKRPQRPV
jgi:6-phosphogluconate dehydrogenase